MDRLVSVGHGSGEHQPPAAGLDNSLCVSYAPYGAEQKRLEEALRALTQPTR
jgi:hypothetical protein